MKLSNVSVRLGIYFTVGLLAARLARGEEHQLITSPDSTWQCEILPRPNSGSEIVVRETARPDKHWILWTSLRWSHVRWSPDSQFVAVTDHYDGHEAAVLVFAAPDSEHPQFRLIYETPRESDFQVKWSVSAWDVKHREITLERSAEDPSHPPGPNRSTSRSQHVIRLGTETIQQNIY